MKISTRGRYAVMAMADMAQQVKSGATGPVSLADISARQEISLNYLEQIFGDLRRGELVESGRGKMGGLSIQRLSHKGLISHPNGITDKHDLGLFI